MRGGCAKHLASAARSILALLPTRRDLRETRILRDPPTGLRLPQGTAKGPTMPPTLTKLSPAHKQIHCGTYGCRREHPEIKKGAQKIQKYVEAPFGGHIRHGFLESKSTLPFSRFRKGSLWDPRDEKYYCFWEGLSYAEGIGLSGGLPQGSPKKEPL